MKHLLPLLLIALLSDLAHAAAPPLAQLADADSTAVILVDDLTGLVEAAQHLPWVAAFNAPLLHNTFSGLRRHLGLSRWPSVARTELGLEEGELGKAVAGPLLLLNRTQGNPDDPFSLLLQFALISQPAEPGQVEELIRNQLERPLWRDDPDATFELTAYEHQGVTLWHRVNPQDPTEPLGFNPGYARVGDTLVWAEPVEYLETLVENVLAGASPTPWGEQASIRTLLSDGQSHHAIFSLHTQQLGALLERNLRWHAGPSKADDPEVLQAVDAHNQRLAELFERLALDNLGPLHGTLDLGENQSDLNFSVTYTDPVGLADLVALRPGPTALPTLLPDTLRSARSARLDLTRVWHGLEALDDQSGSLPTFTTLLRSRLQSIGAERELDLEHDLLDVLGEQLTLGTFPIPFTPEGRETPIILDGTFFAVELHDTQRADALVKLLADAFDYSEKTEPLDYMESRILLFPLVTAGELTLPYRPAYSVTDGYLIYASDLPLVQQAIARLRHPDRVDAPLADTPMGAELTSLGSDASALGFYRGEAIMRPLFEWLLELQRSLVMREGGGCKPRIPLPEGALEGYTDGLINADSRATGRLASHYRVLHHVAP